MSGIAIGVRATVIICTYNPRRAYLTRVLDALKAQTAPKEKWELIIVDNNSNSRVATLYDLTWHPKGRHVLELQLGLTRARLRGIEEASSDLLVFIDDDSVPNVDYLERAIEIALEHQCLGAWGGQCLPEFEVQPPKWTQQFWRILTVRRFAEDHWSSLGLAADTLPFGAACVSEEKVALAYKQRIENDDCLKQLDRTGSGLNSCGDIDMALTACDQKMGTGVFAGLIMTHLVGADRVKEDYLLKLSEGAAYSWAILKARRGLNNGNVRPKWYRRPFGYLRRQFTMGPRRRRFVKARLRGELRALRELEANKYVDHPSHFKENSRLQVTTAV